MLGAGWRQIPLDCMAGAARETTGPGAGEVAALGEGAWAGTTRAGTAWTWMISAAEATPGEAEEGFLIGSHQQTCLMAWLAAVAPPTKLGMAMRGCKPSKAEEPCCRAAWLKSDTWVRPAEKNEQFFTDRKRCQTALSGNAAPGGFPGTRESGRVGPSLRSRAGGATSHGREATGLGHILALLRVFPEPRVPPIPTLCSSSSSVRCRPQFCEHRL